MQRERWALLAVVALVVLVALAGCSGDDPDYHDATVVPGVAAAEQVSANGPAYRVTVSVEVSADWGGPETLLVEDLRIYGYAMDGEHVCTADFGDLRSAEEDTITERTTVRCEGFPAVLVPAAVAAPDPGLTVHHVRFAGRDGDGFRYDRGPVGTRNGKDLDAAFQPPDVLSRPPSEAVRGNDTFVNAWCLQNRSDLDLSPVARYHRDPTLLPHRPADPTFEATVGNPAGGETGESGSTGDGSAGGGSTGDPSPVNASELPRSVRDALADNGSTVELNRSSFLAAASALLDRPVGSVDDLAGSVDGDGNATVSVRDTRTLRCDDLRFRGARRVSVRGVAATADGERHAITLVYRRGWHDPPD